MNFNSSNRSKVIQEWIAPTTNNYEGSEMTKGFIDHIPPLKRRRSSKKSTTLIRLQVKQLMQARDQLKNRAIKDGILWPRYKYCVTK